MSSLYLPALPTSAFQPVPDGLWLPGAPELYRFPLFKLPEFGSSTRGEVAGRIMVALRLFSTWATIDVSMFAGSLIEELVDRVEGRYEQCVLYSMTSDPAEAIDRLYDALSEFVFDQLALSLGDASDFVVRGVNAGTLERGVGARQGIQGLLHGGLGL